MHRRAGSAVAIAAVFMAMSSGCTQLLGVAEISADQTGPGDAMAGSDGGNDGSPGVDVASMDGGPSSDSGDARKCGSDLSGAGSGGFYISFTLQTAQTDGVVPLLNQRRVCTLSTFWDLQMVKRLLYFEIADATGDATVTGQGALLNDSVPHAIVVSRQTNGLVQLMIDGVLVGSATLHQSLGTLPILQIGTSICVGEDPSVDFQGTISNVCLALQ